MKKRSKKQSEESQEIALGICKLALSDVDAARDCLRYADEQVIALLYRVAVVIFAAWISFRRNSS